MECSLVMRETDKPSKRLTINSGRDKKMSERKEMDLLCHRRLRTSMEKGLALDQRSCLAPIESAVVVTSLSQKKLSHLINHQSFVVMMSHIKSFVCVIGQILSCSTIIESPSIATRSMVMPCNQEPSLQCVGFSR